MSLKKISRCLLTTLLSFSTLSATAADLSEIKQRGVIRHLGVRYANFVTGSGDGLDVDLMKGFAKHIGVKYQLVYSDFYSVTEDLLGKKVKVNNGIATLEGDRPIRGDVISTGFTRLPWREQILLFSAPVFPSQVVLIAPAQSDLKPISPSKTLQEDIKNTKSMIGKRSVLVMERTCLDPSNYGLKGVGIELRSYAKSTNINEMVPAMLNGDAELSLLDVPDLMLDLKKWAGQFKVIGPVSEEQVLATAFPKDAIDLKNEFNKYLASLKRSGQYDQLVDKYYPGIRVYFNDFFAKTP